MTWLHQCRPPGSARIWVRRRRSGAGWRCRGCGQLWLLTRRRWETLGGGYSFWEWVEQEDPPAHSGDEPEPDRQGASALVETAYRDSARDDGGRRIPDIQLGFQPNETI